jgi:hypothetical protein
MKRTVGFCFTHQQRFRSVLVRGYIKDDFFRITLALGIYLQPRLSPSVHQPAVIAITHNRKDPGARIAGRTAPANSLLKRGPVASNNETAIPVSIFPILPLLNSQKVLRASLLRTHRFHLVVRPPASA